MSAGCRPPAQDYRRPVKNSLPVVTPWQARFFGEVRLQRGEEIVTRFRSQKTAALFAYLACNSRRDHGREELIARFWPDEDLDNGRNSLRVALSSLRRILEPPPTPSGSILLTTRTHVRLRPNTVRTDVAAFEAALSSGDHETARTLYDAGPFLPGNYEEWVLAERERLAAAAEGVGSGEWGVGVSDSTQPITPSNSYSPLPTPYSLPLTLDRFFGREEELARLEMRLWNPGAEARLVTITGAGGMGKTRLAVEAARRLLDGKTGIANRSPFPGGAWFVPLAGETDASALAETLPLLVRQAMGLPADARRDPLEQVAAHLDGRAALFLLDNLEQVAEGAITALTLLLQRIPGATLLVTSRVRLGLRGEHLLALTPLPVPDADTSLDALAETPSARLFAARAREAESDFALTPGNAAETGALLRLLEGVPLAIELTASWANVLTPRQMREQMEKRLGPDESAGGFAARRADDRAPRHRSLYAAFQWSYDLLEPEARALLARLSVFRGGFTAEAAESVTETASASARLARLHSHSLLTVRPTPDGSAVRFALLESLREFAADRLSPEERESLAARHTDFYLRFAEEQKPLYGTAETARALDRIGQEYDNVRAALDRTAASGDSASIALRLAAAMQWPWRVRGPLAEGRRYLTEILSRPDARLDSEARADALNALGSIVITQRDMDEARTRYTESLELCRRLDYTPGRVAALSNLATAHMDGGAFDAARPLFEEALTLIRATGHRGREAVVLNNLGNLAHWQRDLDDAARFHAAALEIRRELGDTRGIALSQVGLGILAMERGDFADARTRLRDGLRLQHELGDQSQIDTALENVARAEEGLGNLEQGVTLRAAAHALRAHLGITSPPLRQETLDAEMALLRERLPAPALTDAWTTGSAFTLEDAVAFALRDEK